MIPPAFDYHRPTSVGAAVSLLAQHGDEARLLAGGQSLTPMMKLRMATPSHLVDLQDISELRGARTEAGVVVIGAMCRQAELIANDGLARLCPILREAALQIADPQVREMGTVGGNVANGDPGNDMPGLMQCLDALYVLQGPNGKREVAARDFYEAAYFTAAEDGEILTQIRIPTPPIGHGWAYEKQKRKIGDYATAAAAVMLTMSGGVCQTASVALTNLADTPLMASQAAAALRGSTLDAPAIEAAAKAAMAVAQPTEDGRGSADFKTHIAGMMVRRAIARAAERAKA